MSDQLGEFRKALEAGVITNDVSALTNGGALGRQSLDPAMVKIVTSNKDFVLSAKVPVEPCGNLKDEWTENTDIGGIIGGSANSEMGTLSASNSVMRRRVGTVKHLMLMRGVSSILQAQDSITSPEATEITNGMLQLLRDKEHLMFEGNSAVIYEQFDGLRKQLNDFGSSDNIVDMAGSPLNSIDPFSHAAEVITTRGFGNASEIFTSFSVQTDMNAALNQASRALLTASPTSLVPGFIQTDVNTSFGVLKMNQARYVRDEQSKKIFQTNPNMAALAVANSILKPTAITVDATVTDGASKWASGQDGNYYYAITGLSTKGESEALLTSQAVIAVGKKATITITSSVGATENGYVIYRSRRNGTNALTDFREMVRIPRTGTSTVYVDFNTDIPGSTDAYVLDVGSDGQRPIVWREYAKMQRMDLSVTNQLAKNWAQWMSGYLRLAIAQRHVLIKNIVPTGAKWKPFI